MIEMLKRKEGIDAGAIWGRSRIVGRHVEIKIIHSPTPSQPTSDDETFTSLRNTLALAGGKLLVSVLRSLRTGKVSCLEDTKQ